MKKNSLRITALFLAMALSICIAGGCGQSDSSGTETEQTVDTAEESGQEPPQYMTDDNAGTPGQSGYLCWRGEAPMIC